jgi:Protein of unknown function (DUF2971)
MDRHIEDHKELLGSVLYRYRDLSSQEKLKQTCDSIRESYIYWTSPKYFNDPFDSRPAFVFDGTKEDHWKAAKRSANVLQAGQPRSERRRVAKQSLALPRELPLKAMREASEQELERYGVACLTTERDNILMWSHYAGNHTGVCLGYKPSQKAMDFACAYKVRYEPVRPQYNLMHSMMKQNVFEALVTKSLDWKYENEWRMIDHRIANRKRNYPPCSLAEIIFGCQVSGEAREAILSAVAGSRSKPAFFSSRPSETHFTLDLIPHQTI